MLPSASSIVMTASIAWLCDWKLSTSSSRSWVRYAARRATVNRSRSSGAIVRKVIGSGGSSRPSSSSWLFVGVRPLITDECTHSPFCTSKSICWWMPGG